MACNCSLVNRYKPGVRKTWLYFLAGFVWMLVGAMLLSFAYRWLKPVSVLTGFYFVVSGILLAACIYFLGFSKLAKKNIQRICSITGENVCLFAFQEWKSYPLVGFMIALGVYLRVYSPVPRPMLAILYLGIGGGLSSSSLHYFRQAIHTQSI